MRLSVSWGMSAGRFVGTFVPTSVFDSTPRLGVFAGSVWFSEGFFSLGNLALSPFFGTFVPGCPVAIPLARLSFCRIVSGFMFVGSFDPLAYAAILQDIGDGLDIELIIIKK